jgi:hypothetical protein
VVVDREQIIHDAGECHGATSTRRHVIVVDGSLEGTSLAEVLLHELLHACLAGATLEDEAEEAMVNAAAGPLLDALRSNPGLVRVLLA